jgi:hypothetical protein
MAETILLPSGEAYPIEWTLWNGAALLTGKTVTLSIERYSDGKYWTGSAWQVAYTTVNMAERSGTADLVGKYRYAFTVGDDIYDCHTTYTEGTFTTHFRVRLVGQNFAGGAIIAGPITAVTQASQQVEAPVKLEMFALETRAFVLSVEDANGDPVDLDAITLRFIVHDSQKSPNAQFKIEDDSIVVSGADNEIATVSVNGTQASAATTEWHWKLWDLTNSRVLMHGPFVVYPARKDT